MVLNVAITKPRVFDSTVKNQKNTHTHNYCCVASRYLTPLLFDGNITTINVIRTLSGRPSAYARFSSVWKTYDIVFIFYNSFQFCLRFIGETAGAYDYFDCFPDRTASGYLADNPQQYRHEQLLELKHLINQLIF